MKIQNLYCHTGDHNWTRESQRGKPPKNCEQHSSSAGRDAFQSTPTPRSVPVRVVEGSEQSDSVMTPDQRAEALTERMGRLHAIRDRKVIER